jgi:flagellar assembly protein FliH
MKSSCETIRLSRPLRNVRRAGTCAPAPASEAVIQAQVDGAYQRGRADGEKALNELLLKQRAEMQELLQGVVASLQGAVPRVVRDTENALVSLAVAVAQKVVAGIPISAEAVEATVREALAQVEGTAEFTVRLNRADLELLKTSHSTVLAEADGKQFRFLPSGDVTPGGCLIETHFGTIDARRETKFDAIKRSLAT